MYRGPRAIDVATMAAVTMAARTAADKSTPARDGRSAARNADVPLAATGTASRAAWAHRESRCARVCARARRAAPSEAAPCARARCTAAPCARAAPLLQGDSPTEPCLTAVHSNLSRAEGNFDMLSSFL